MQLFKDEEEAIKKISEEIGVTQDIIKSKNNQEYREEGLKKILRKISIIPYENLTKHINKKKLISPSDILFGLKNLGTGATCFPLVYLLKRILDFCSIDSKILLADRTYAPKSHTLILAQIGDKSFIVDIGFLIFTPIDISDGSIQVKLPQGEISFIINSKNIETYTIFPNGHKKFRYKAHIEKASDSEFVSAWEKTYFFEMMNHIVVSKVLEDKIIYIRDNFVHFIQNGVSKNLKMEKSDVLKIIEKIGINKNIFSSLWDSLLNQTQ